MALPLFASGKDERFQYLVFGKAPGILELLREMLLLLGVADRSILDMTVRGGGPVTVLLEGRQRPEHRDIATIVDEHYWFFGEEFHVNVIFGMERVFFVAHLPPEMRTEIMRLVDERAEFVT
jgi:hypothetical protein